MSPRAAELIRRGAVAVSQPQAEWVEDLHRASLSGDGLRSIAADPALVESTRRANEAILLTWVASNVQRPGQRVRPHLTPEMLEHSRDLVRRGLDGAVLDANRKGQSAAWQHWMQVCFTLTDDVDELHEILIITSLSIETYVDDTMEAVRTRIEQERTQLTTGTHAERLAAVALLLEGAPVDPRTVEARLGYALTGPHTGVVVWGAPGVDPTLLESAAEAVLDGSSATRRLTVIANASTLWVWLPGPLHPEAGREVGLEAALADRVRVAVGRTSRGRDGFRMTHLEAIEVQRTMSRAGGRRRVAFYRDIALVSVMEQDAHVVESFLDATLGDLRSADAELWMTALTYLQEMSNVARTAGRLYSHRNTVLRRLRQVDQLLPRPLADNPVHVGAALELMSWRSP